MTPQPWSRRIDGLWLASKGGKVRHLYRTRYGQNPTVWVGQCDIRIANPVVANGERYNALPPCKNCLAGARRQIDYWQGVLNQQGAA